MFTQPDVKTREVGRTKDNGRKLQSGVISRLLSVLPTSQVFTSGYVNTETILYFFYKITNERGTKTLFTYAHVKWFYGQSEHTHYLNYFYSSIWCVNFTYLLLSECKVHSECVGQKSQLKRGGSVTYNTNLEKYMQVSKIFIISLGSNRGERFQFKQHF